MDELLSQKSLAELMVEAVGATSTRDGFSKRRSRLLPKSQLLQILGSDVVSSLTLTPNVTVSRCCISREGRCCVGRTPMTVDMYRAGERMEPILCTDDLEKLQFEHNLLCPPPPPPPSEQQSRPNDEAVSAFDSVVQDLKRSRPEDGSGPTPPPSAFKKHKVHVGAVVDGGAGIAIEERPIDKSAGTKFLHKMFLKATKVRNEDKA